MGRRSVSVFVALALTACGGSHALLQRNPRVQPSEQFRCPRQTTDALGTLSGPCTPAVIADAEFNASGTTHFELPLCPFGYSRILTSDREVLVECAARDHASEEIVPTTTTEAP